MSKNKRAKTRQLFTVEPEPPKQETPAPPSRKDTDQFVDQFMYLLTAPYMFYPPWGDIWTYEDRKNDALMHRLAHGKEIWETQQCTEYEAMVYISTATLSAPPSHDWYCIYAWLFRRWRPEQGAEIFNDREGEKLNVNQEEDLTRLRQWIFSQQMKHMKAKRKTAATGEPAPAPEVVEHPRLF